MIGQIPSKDLGAALRRLKTLVQKAVGMESDKAVVLGSRDGAPLLYASDGTLEAGIRIPGEWSGDPVWVAHDAFLGIVRGADGADVRVRAEGTRLMVEVGSFSAKLQTAPYGSDLPRPPHAEEEVDARLVGSVVQVLSGFTEDNEHRPMVSAIWIEGDGERLVARAMDGVVAVELDREGLSGRIGPCPLPTRSAPALLPWLAEEEKIACQADERAFSFSRNGSWVRGSAILANRFDLGSFWSKEEEVRATWEGEAEPMIEAIQRVARVGDGSAVLLVVGDGLRLRTAPGPDEAEEAVGGQVGGGARALVDPSRLAAVLRAVAPRKARIAVHGGARELVTICGDNGRALLCGMRLRH
jgi:hypothetical protein